jgi:hypothetical protein
MPPTPNHPYDIQSITVLVVVVASLGVIYWRTTLRLIAIAVVAFAIYGFILVLYGLRHI